MKIKHLSILILMICSGCANTSPEKSATKRQREIKLVFPGQPEVLKESASPYGQEMDITIKSLPLDSSFYMHYEMEFKNSVDSSISYQKDFFSGFLSYILNDLGVQLGEISKSDFDHNTGFDFEIIIPNSNVAKSARGKAIFLDKKASVWFAFAASESSSGQVSEFLENYNIE